MTDATNLTAFDQSAAFRNHPLIASAHVAGENRNTFEAFVRGFIGDLQPVGTVEATLAARAAGIAWRLNRAQGLETKILTHSRDYNRKTLLEDAVGYSSARDTVEMVSRWEQELERSLFKTLDALHNMQRRRRQHEKSGNQTEAGDEKSNLLANERQTPRKEIDFDGEAPVVQSERETGSTP